MKCRGIQDENKKVRRAARENWKDSDRSPLSGLASLANVRNDQPNNNNHYYHFPLVSIHLVVVEVPVVVVVVVVSFVLLPTRQ